MRPRLALASLFIRQGIQNPPLVVAKDKPIFLLHFDNHLDAIEWLWATVVVGFVPAISTPLVNDLGQRKKHLLHVNSTLQDPVILTTAHLKPELLDIEHLRIHTVEELENGHNYRDGVHRPLESSTKATGCETLFPGAYANPGDRPSSC